MAFDIFREIIGDVVSDAFQRVARFIARVLVQGLGTMAIKVVRPRSDPGEVAVAVAGIVVWLVVFGVAYLVCRHIDIA